MSSHKEKDELDGVEKISPQQAIKEMQEAAKKVRGEHPATASRGGEQDEMADVESISREQAEKEIRAAAQKAKKEHKGK